MAHILSPIQAEPGPGANIPAPFTLLSETPNFEFISRCCDVAEDEIEDIYPCTPLQEGLMAITAQQRTAYIAQMALSIPGSIPIMDLRSAFQCLVSLCPILRTRIILDPSGKSIQVVTRRAIEWQDEVSLSSYLQNDLAQSMDYGTPLTRLAIIDDQKYGLVLVWTIHHALYDGWTVRLLFNHLEQIYQGISLPRPTAFSTFIGYLQEVTQSDLTSFWRRQLVGNDCTSWPEVPSQAKVNANQTIHQSIYLPGTLQHDVTVSTLVRAAWAITLGLHAASERVIFAEVLSGRNIPLPHVTEVVGPMLSTVPMSVDIDFSLTVGEFVRQIQIQVANLIEYQHAGLQNIHRLLLAEGQELPTLNNMFIFQPREESGDEAASLGLKEIPGCSMELGIFDTFPVNVQCILQENSVDVHITFDGAIVPSETMAHVLAVFVHLSQELAKAESNLPLCDLNLVPATDLALVQFTQTPPLPPVRSCIHQIIEHHVRQTPEAIAIHGYDAMLTYEQLWWASDALAETLIHAGVNRGVLVPLCFEKSVWAIVSMVAVLKAGGACVNLDFSYPLGRIETIIRDTEARVILASSAQRDRLAALVPSVIVADERLAQAGNCNRSSTLESISSQPEDAAFVIYTSGTTGKPKGIVNTHQALASSAAAHGAVLDIGPQTRAIQFASYAFDSSIQDISTVLQRGGCICVISETDRTSNFPAAVRSMKGNYSLLTSSVASLYTPKDLPSVRTLQLGGEPMRKSILQAWGSHARVMNTYGPAECSINVTCASDLQANDMENDIGTPVGCRCWVVQPNDASQLLPLGCVGELLVEGPILARGYLHDPEKTNAVFISTPAWRRGFPIEPCERLYRTGDLVFQSDDGSFRYVGRKDAQVKLNGQRLEVEEIESLLQRHPTIAQTAVVLPKVGPMSNRLVATFTLSDPTGALDDLSIRPIDATVRVELVNSLQRALSQALPSSIKVSYFVPVWNLPLTISRKLDRKRIRAWFESMSTDTYEAAVGPDVVVGALVRGPRSPMETAVHNACARVLSLPATRVDLQRSFFGIGGDSIGAIQLVSLLRGEGIVITVPDILQARTLVDIAELAKVESEPGCGADEPDDELFGLSPIQQWYLSQRSSNADTDISTQYFNQSTYLKLDRHVDERELRQAITAIVKHHPMLRARYQMVNGKWHQAICLMSPNSFAFQAHDLAYIDETRLADVAKSSHVALDIHNGPVFSADLFNFSNGDQSLLLIAHHLVVDIVSWTILLDDLDVLLRGKPTPLHEKTSFQSWYRHKFASLVNSSTADELYNNEEVDFQYWGLSQESQLTNGSQDRKIVCVDSKTTSLILGASNHALRTEPVDLFLSGLCMSFLNTFSDRQELTIFTEGHGRDFGTRGIDVSRTVGWFTSVASLCLSYQHGSDPTSIVQRIKDLRKLTRPLSEEAFARQYVNSKFGQEQPKEFLFNYHGISTQTEAADTLFHQEHPPPYDVPDQGPDVPISALFEILVTVENGVAEFTVYWPEQLLYQTQIAAWIDGIPDCLRQLATQLMQCERQFYSLSDFPLLALDHARLDRLQKRVLPHIRQHCRAPIQEVLPCSPMQDGILIAQTKQGRNYQTAQKYEVCSTAAGGSVDIYRLAAAWKQIILRHPMLRTVFVESIDDSSAFSQVVLESFEPDILFVDASKQLVDLPPVDYSQLRPPHRLALAPTSSGATVCLLELSHTIIDGQSAGIIVHDWVHAYEGNLQAQKDPQLTYTGFIKHIRAIPRHEKLKHWTTYLANLELCHFPPLPDTNPLTQYQTAVCEVDEHESTRIRQYCTEVGVSMATLFQASWTLVLSQYTGMDDVCFGYLASGRDAPVAGIKDAVGAFVNMLICRAQFSSSQVTASQFLQDLQQQSLEHLKFQHCTLAEIHHALGIPHGQALFNTIMSFQRDDKDARPDDHLPSLKFVDLDGQDPTEYDLSIGITAGLHAIKLSLDYCDSYISPQQASAILSSFRCALNTMVDNPNSPVGEMCLLSKQELATIEAWNGPFPSTQECSVHAVVNAQAWWSPVSPAISSFDDDLTYGQLDDLSNRLAQHLVLAGVQLEHMVPLCFDKSTWAAVSMLAVLKAGGVCVPLGPASPERRLHETLADIQSSVVLLAPQHLHLFEGVTAHTIIIDRDFLVNLPSFRHPSLLPYVGPKNAAFVVYTSGSTGKPKGIVLEHGAVVTSSQAHGSAMGITASSRVLQFSAYTFDVYIQDIFTTWQRGGCVCIISEHERLNDLTNSINTHQANFADFTPTVAALIQPSHVPCLKTISMGGEVVPKSLNELWQPHTRVLNIYGPAEACINTAYTDKADRDQHAAAIGRPLASWFWVVDPKDVNRLVPIGCFGELLIEGPLLARGYLNDIAKTQAAFIINPKWSQSCSLENPMPTRRMYKTGDLVRLNHNGTYTYIGRKDRQVKVYGQRIELGEIEHHLQRLVPDDVGVAVEAVAVRGRKQKSRLAAFLEWSSTISEHESADSDILLPVNNHIAQVLSDLRDSLQELLPSHMLPSLYVPLRQFPLTTSGKLDRRRLIGLVESMPLSEQNRISTSAIGIKQAPATQAQKILHSLVAPLLSLSPVAFGIDDSFFALGGDSVSAIMLAQEARKRGLRISVADILRHPRIHDMAHVATVAGLELT